MCRRSLQYIDPFVLVFRQLSCVNDSLAIVKSSPSIKETEAEPVSSGFRVSLVEGPCIKHSPLQLKTALVVKKKERASLAIVIK